MKMSIYKKKIVNVIYFLILFLLFSKGHGDHNDADYSIVELRVAGKDFNRVIDLIENNILDVFKTQTVRGDKVLVGRILTTNIALLNKEYISYKIKRSWGRTHLRTPGDNPELNTFWNYTCITEFVHELKRFEDNITNVELVSIGKTVEKRDIWMVKITHLNVKNIVFIEAGIHAREWLAPMTAVNLLMQLTRYKDKNPKLLKMNWHIVPIANPDGYELTFTSDRMHRKNTNPKYCHKTCKPATGCGVDLNRNFDFHFGVSGVSNNVCSQIYPGPKGFSEPESTAIANALKKNAQHIILYIGLHCYGNQILYPWGYKKVKCDDWKDLEEAAIVAAAVMNSNATSDSENFVVANTGLYLYPAAGSSDDYAKGVLNIKYSYAIELQGEDFNPPASLIEQYVKTTFLGLSAIATYVNNIFNTPKDLGMN